MALSPGPGPDFWDFPQAEEEKLYRKIGERERASLILHLSLKTRRETPLCSALALVEAGRQLHQTWLEVGSEMPFSYLFLVCNDSSLQWVQSAVTVNHHHHHHEANFRSQTTRKSEDFRPYSAVQSRKWKEENKKTFCIYCSQGKQLKCSGYFYNST